LVILWYQFDIFDSVMPFSLFKKTPSLQNIKKTRSAEIREAESSLQTSFEEVELLRLKIAEQEKEISLLNSNLSSTEQKLFIANTENKNLAQTLVKAKVIRSSKFDFDALSSSVDDQTSNLNKSQQESKLQAENIDEIQSELSKIMMINDKLELKLCEEKNNNEKLVSSLQNEMKALKDKCSVMEKLHLKQDKQISELTMERNQREAKVGEMEKRAKRAEAKCKECEVDSNRIRQYLAMATSKNQQLTNQFVKSRKENESMKKVFSMKTVDSLQSKLDELANAMKEKEISHKKTIDIYRQHLYNAYQGTLDPEVVSVLEEIKETKIREENEIKAT